MAEGVGTALANIQAELYARALARREETLRTCTSYEGFKAELERGGFIRTFWADDAANEETIKEETKATIRCFPLEGQEAASGQTCFYSGRPATHVALFARAY